MGGEKETKQENVRYVMLVWDEDAYDVYPPGETVKRCFRSLEEAKQAGFEAPIAIEESSKSIVYRGYYRGEPALLVALINDRWVEQVRYIAEERRKVLKERLKREGIKAELGEIKIPCLEASKHGRKRKKRGKKR